MCRKYVHLTVTVLQELGKSWATLFTSKSWVWPRLLGVQPLELFSALCFGLCIYHRLEYWEEYQLSGSEAQVKHLCIWIQANQTKYAFSKYENKIWNQINQTHRLHICISYNDWFAGWSNCPQLRIHLLRDWLQLHPMWVTKKSRIIRHMNFELLYNSLYLHTDWSLRQSQTNPCCRLLDGNIRASCGLCTRLPAAHWPREPPRLSPVQPLV